MAEETKTEESTVNDEGSMAEGSAEAAEATKAAEAAAAVTTPSETEQKLQEQFNELQGRFDTLSQDSSKQRQYLDEITPYVDFDGLKAASQPGEGSSEEDQSFVTKEDLARHTQKIEQKIKTADFTREFRTKYPDLGDKGPKEEMVRFYFENKTLRTDSFDKRIESAVKATRNLLKNEVDTALAEKKAAEEKATQELKKKEEAAAKASGISSGTITSPQKTESKETPSTSDYVAERRETQQKLKAG